MHYELIIVGAGPAGLTAGLYASRSRTKTLLLESISPGGQMLKTYHIDNWPGEVEGVNGYDLAMRMHDHAIRFGLEITVASLKACKLDGRKKILTTDQGEYTCDALILATGAQPVTLNIPGEEKFTGRGVSYCATCDAPFYRDQKVAVVGGGNTAVEEALYLTRFTDQVKLIHRRDELRADRILLEDLARSKIELLLSHVPLKVEGENNAKGLWVRDLKTQKEYMLELDGLFVFVGSAPNTGFDIPGLDRNPAGFIVTNHQMQTSLPGVFAVGDCRDNQLKQVVVAAGEGALAAYMAQNFLEKK